MRPLFQESILPNIAYIGGGFEGTLHNSLEAAIWDLPILYGNHKNNQNHRFSFKPSIFCSF